MVLGADYTKLPNNQILNLYSTHLETEKIEKGLLGLYGSQELMLEQEN